MLCGQPTGVRFCSSKSGANRSSIGKSSGKSSFACPSMWNCAGTGVRVANTATLPRRSYRLLIAYSLLQGAGTAPRSCVPSAGRLLSGCDQRRPVRTNRSFCIFQRRDGRRREAILQASRPGRRVGRSEPSFHRLLSQKSGCPVWNLALLGGMAPNRGGLNRALLHCGVAFGDVCRCSRSSR